MSKTLLALLSLVIASLQAWDAGALGAEPAIKGLVLAGVLLPAVALLATPDVRVRGAAVAAAAGLMIAARFWSAQPMPALALAAFFPGVLVLLDHIRTLNRKANVPVVEPPRRE